MNDRNDTILKVGSFAMLVWIAILLILTHSELSLLHEDHCSTREHQSQEE